MAFTSGSATDWINLADVFRNWIVSVAGWSQLAWTPGNVDTGGMSLYLRGPGAGADKQVFVNIQSVQDDSIPAYAWDIRGAVAYDSNLSFSNQPSCSSQTLFSLWKSTISYWFYANDRRFIIIAKCNTLYMSLYAGFGLPWATPAEYPFPIYIGGSDGILRAFTSTNSAHNSFCNPGGSSTESGGDFNGGKIRKQDGSWERVQNQKSGTANDNPYNFNSITPFVFPYSLRGGDTIANSRSWTGLTSSGGSYDTGAVDNLVPTAQDERLLMPVSIMNCLPPGGFMALDGVYFPMGQGLSPEQTATFDSRTFRFFPAIHRITCNDFFAIEEN